MDELRKTSSVALPIGGGVHYELAGGWQLYGNYDAQVNTQQVFHVGSGGLQYAW